jgi:hypothetical protein
MGWSDKIKGALGQSVEQKIRENLPAIQQMFRDKVGNDLRNHLADPEKVISSSKMVYSLLPMPVRLMVKEDAFVNFCIQHKNELLG